MADKTETPGKPLLPPDGPLASLPPRKWHLLLAGACVALVYLAGVTGRWWPSPDSALYLGLARSLAEGDGYRFNGSIQNIVTPGFPLILAGLQLAFGPGFRVPNLFMALCGLGTILLVYLTVCRLSDRRMALIVALSTALSYTFFHQSRRILTDTPFTVLFWALLYTYLRYRRASAWWLVPVGLLTVAATAIRAPGMIILCALAAGLMIDSLPAGRRSGNSRNMKGLFSGVVILATVAAMGAGFYLIACAYTKGTPLYVRSVVSRTTLGVWEHISDMGLGLAKWPLAVSEMLTGQETYFVGLPAMLLACIGAIRLWRRRHRFVLPFIVLSVLILALMGGSHAIRPRYLLPIQPLVMLAIMEGLCWIAGYFTRRKAGLARPTRSLKVLTVFTALVIASNLPKVLRSAVYYNYLSYTPRYYEVILGGQHAALIDVAEALRTTSGDSREVAVDTDKMSILHYLSRRITVPLPKTPRHDPADAGKIREFFLSRSHLGFIVLDVEGRGSSKAYRNSVKMIFDQTPGIRLAYENGRYRVYENVRQKGA